MLLTLQARSCDLKPIRQPRLVLHMLCLVLAATHYAYTVYAQQELDDVGFDLSLPHTSTSATMPPAFKGLPPDLSSSALSEAQLLASIRRTETVQYRCNHGDMCTSTAASLDSTVVPTVSPQQWVSRCMEPDLAWLRSVSGNGRWVQCSSAVACDHLDCDCHVLASNSPLCAAILQGVHCVACSPAQGSSRVTSGSQPDQVPGVEVCA
jgi:hypothetical protein